MTTTRPPPPLEQTDCELPAFRPRAWLRSGHAQTIRAAFDAPRIAYRAQPHLLATTDGDELVLHDDCPPDWTAGSELALLIHGLGGCHGSPYLVRIAHKLHARGVRVFRLDLRGCGAGRDKARFPGHAGRSEDVAAAVRFLEQLAPASPIVLAGFSLGANIVLKFLAEYREETRRHIVRALAVAPPIDLMACALHLEQWPRWAYNRWFVRALMRELRRRRATLPETLAFDWARPPRSLREFDDRVTAPWSGFRDVEDYYSRSSAKPLLAGLETPTTILAAEDDPVVPAAIFDHVALPPQVTVHRTAHGGHVGYFGVPGRDPDGYWLDWRVVDFVLRGGW